MYDTLTSSEPMIRFGFFSSVLAVMVLWELGAARRPQRIGRRSRWPGNLTVAALNTVMIRLIFPLAAVGGALLAADRGWGLFNLVTVPTWISLLATVLLLDAAIYFQHRIFHAVPWLWRLHRMHHTDLELDVTTGLRFHPLEMLISMGIKMVVVVALGAPALAVVIFEILLNATSMFNHANVRLPLRIDRWLRLIVVTPDMHRVHHSTIRRETDSNFGFNLPWWDRLFGSYRDQPEKGHLGMTLGLEDFRTEQDLRLDRMLIQPFRATTPRDAP